MQIEGEKRIFSSSTYHTGTVSSVIGFSIHFNGLRYGEKAEDLQAEWVVRYTGPSSSGSLKPYGKNIVISVYYGMACNMPIESSNKMKGINLLTGLRNYY